LAEIGKQKIREGGLALQGQEDTARINSLIQGAIQLKQIQSPEAKLSFLENRRAQLQQARIDTSDTEEAIALARAGDFAELEKVTDQAIALRKHLRTEQMKAFAPVETDTESGPGLAIPTIDTRTGEATLRPIPLGEDVVLARETPVQKAAREFEEERRTAGAEIKEAGRRAEVEGLANIRINDFQNVKDAAAAADLQNEQLDQLASIDVSTGFGVEARSEIARGVNAIFGEGSGDQLLNVNVPAVQAFKAISGRIQNTELNKAKGPQTDDDARRVAKTLPNIANEQLAKDFLIKSLRAINDRAIRQAEFFEDFRDTNGSLKGSDKAWREFKKKTPLVSEAITDPETGLPMFFNDFRRQVLVAHPGATDSQILFTWRKRTKGKR
jgi:hypothetical protein